MMRSLLALVVLCSCLACDTSDERLPELYGTWQGVAWTTGDASRAGAEDVTFVFREDATYEASMGAQAESGDFVFRDAKVYTTASGDRKVEKVVGVERLAGDTLVFDMNRAGTPERLTLARR